MEKVAIFDIGSNAVRLVIAQIKAKGPQGFGYEFTHRHRVPFRLGTDAFTAGKFSEKTLKRGRQIFKGLVQLAHNYGVDRIEAVATAAMREAKNSQELIGPVRDKSKLDIRVISGEQEAFYLFKAIGHHIPEIEQGVVMIDIGGGSTELSFARGQELILSQSFPVGTVRLIKAKSHHELHDTIAQFEASIEEFAKRLKTKTKRLPRLMVGTGGNLRRLGKLKPFFFSDHDASCIKRDQIAQMREAMTSMGPKELQKRYQLKPYRSETIRPAALIVLMALEKLGIDDLMLPNLGLADGVLLELLSPATALPASS